MVLNKQVGQNCDRCANNDLGVKMQGPRTLSDLETYPETKLVTTSRASRVLACVNSKMSRVRMSCSKNLRVDLIALVLSRAEL